ncbi:MAG: hypothetical protein GX410_02425 [Elusimicrobia bacterium]|nr:hypothetical protein [Elusimicrobiota bacterium]
MTAIPNALQIWGQNRAVDAELTVSSRTGTAENLRDRDPENCWVSSGSSDSVEESIRLMFRDAAGQPAAFGFDRVLLLNTNAKNLRGQYYASSTGGGTAVPELAAQNSAQDALFQLSAPPFTPWGFSLHIQDTRTAGQEKFLGELKLCKHLLTLDALTSFDRSDYAREGSYYLAGGGLVRWREFTRFAGTLTVKNLSKTGRDLLRRACLDYDFLTLAFFTEYDLRQTYDVAVAAPPRETFDRKTMLYEMTLEVKER